MGMYRSMGYDIYRVVDKYYSSQTGPNQDANGKLSGLFRYEKINASRYNSRNFETNRKKNTSKITII